METTDEARLETDLAYRFNYLAQFMAFTDEDVAAIHAAAPLIGPVVPALVDAVYDKLFSYDSTKRHFVRRQSGYSGPIPRHIHDVTQSHEMIQYRKGHLATYLNALVTRPYDGAMQQYLDRVGQMHTPKAGNAQLDVPLVQMNALMGFVSDAILTTILGLGLEPSVQSRTLRAFNKLLWLQNDLITRHYTSTAE